MRTTNGEAKALETALAGWRQQLAEGVASLGRLLALPAEEQRRLGYGETLREIVQQPVTWEDTAARVSAAAERLRAHMGEPDALGHVLLTGSGSSQYVGECVGHFLRKALRSPVSVIASGDLLTHEDTSLPPQRLWLTVSFARSGNSPESVAALVRLQRRAPEARHLIVSCSSEGRLAACCSRERGVENFLLNEATNDRSLVMTSSFTNMALVGRCLGRLGRPDGGAGEVRELATACRALLLEHAERLVALGGGGFGSACFLGSGDALGAAREASLKMVEMTAGEVRGWAESFLGLRHGPMSGVRPDTLVVAFLSSEHPARDYERDLLLELWRKGLGAHTLVVGERLPAELSGEGRTLVSWPATGLEGVEVLDVVVGQLLAFGRCLSLGLSPDAPSREDVITRVVSPFPIYEREP